MNAHFTSRLSASRRFVLRSRACRALLWLLALCFALDGALLAAKPLPMGTTKVAVAACHQGMAHQSGVDIGHAAPGCCHGGGDCACAGAHVLAELERPHVAAGVPAAQDTLRAATTAFARRTMAPPLRPPIA